MNNLKIPLAALTSLLLFREHPNMFLLFIGCLLILSSFLIAPIPFKKLRRNKFQTPIFLHFCAACRRPENATCYARFTKKPVRPAHAAHAPDCGRAH